MADAFKELASTVERIGSLMTEAGNAYWLPENGERAAKSIEIHTRTSYSGSKDTEGEAVARAIQNRLAAELRAKGEAARDAKLAEIALAVESLRGLLPGLAASASIHLGVLARANFPQEKKS